ncbi:hypothetical protein PHLCEN_2v10159 [Hermanssonia centrifuga]|uniref:Uncharacterized protein n=1 Tax=Hermanssonia centrifuga TaxID=98765 RepID=A0A2R6NNP1_9APHY|nr:hypothetical protein PHLCEN_2v10159 [Hermanssonia centrifuga]
MSGPSAGSDQELGTLLHATLLYLNLGAHSIQTLSYPILASLVFPYLPVGFVPALWPNQP